MASEEAELTGELTALGNALHDAICGTPLLNMLSMDYIYMIMGGIIITLLCWNLIDTRRNYQALRKLRLDYLKEHYND